MPVTIASDILPAAPREIVRTVSRISLVFRDDGSNAVDMLTEFIRVTRINGEVSEVVPDGSVLHRFEEIAAWPEFPAAYLRIRDEVYARREQQDAAAVAPV